MIASDLPYDFQIEIQSFSFLEEAVFEISGADDGDLIILDAPSWLTLRAHENVDQWERLLARHLAFILLMPIKAAKINPFKLDGLSALISLDASIDEIGAGIRNVILGSHSSCEILEKIAPSILTELSPKQRCIANLIVEGFSNKQIAYELGMSNGTVKSHVTEIFRKLDCHRRTQIISAFNLKS